MSSPWCYFIKWYLCIYSLLISGMI